MRKKQVFGKAVAVLLCFTMFVGIIVGARVESVYARTTHSRDEALSWANSKIGSSLDYDGVYGAQCVDLIAYYYAYLGTKTPGGNAIDYASNKLPDGWTRVYGDYQPGDIAVFYANLNNYQVMTSAYGHVAIITSIDGNYFWAVDQNGGSNKGYCASNRYNLGCIKCVIRPDFNNISASDEATYYSTVFSENVTDTNAKIYAKLTANYSLTNEGFYISKNADMSGSTKVEERVSGKVTDLWYEMHKWYGALDRGTTYYYQIFIVTAGVEHKSDVRSFNTTCSHNYNAGEITTAPTCVNDGVRTYTCTWCGATYSEAVAKTGNHSYNDGVITTAPTCATDGVKTYTCMVCGAAKTETVAKTGNHSYKQVTQDATTTLEGWTAKVCTVCGDVKDKTIIAKKEEKVTFGWSAINGRFYWYENGVIQGTYNDAKGVWGDGSVRGREIYDPSSSGWYWLDSVYGGAKACSKEVWMPYIYQNEDGWGSDEIAMNASNSGDMAAQVIKAINNKEGKWVRYDANGKMYKGWYTVSGSDALIYPSQAGNTYYYDPMTGLMAKGYVQIDGNTYHFDEMTGVLQ